MNTEYETQDPQPNLARQIKRQVWPHAWPLFAVCAPGLEEVCEAELESLGAGALEVRPGGVAFEGRVEMLYTANLWLRSAGRVLFRLSDFRVRRWDDLLRQAARAPWEYFLAPKAPYRIQVTLKDSNLRHEGRIAEEVGAAIEKRFRSLNLEPPAPVRPDQAQSQLIAVRGHDRRCTFSLDASGDHLHRRGYRLATGKAPLREDLAAALLIFSGYTGEEALLDPMCGSGTLPIEGSLLARDLAPGLERAFALENWACHRKAAWEHLKKLSREESLPAAPNPIWAWDNNPGAIRSAKDNAERAGVSGDVEIVQADFFKEPAPKCEPGILVVNPPYGKRIGSVRQAERLIQKLGAKLKADYRGWRVSLVLYLPEWQRFLNLKNTRAITAPHGGVKVTMLSGEAE